MVLVCIPQCFMCVFYRLDVPGWVGGIVWLISSSRYVFKGILLVFMLSYWLNYLRLDFHCIILMCILSSWIAYFSLGVLFSSSWLAYFIISLRSATLRFWIVKCSYDTLGLDLHIIEENQHSVHNNILSDTTEVRALCNRSPASDVQMTCLVTLTTLDRKDNKCRTAEC